MILTGKAKQDFEKWLEFNYEELLNDLPNYIDELAYTALYAHIVEWFDSVGIFITIEYFHKLKNFSWKIKRIEGGVIEGLALLFNRTEATKAAILTANDLYNER